MPDSKPKTPEAGSDMNFLYVIIFFIILYLGVSNFLSSNTDLTQNVSEVSKNFILLLPEYFVSFMLRIFSFSLILSSILIVVVIILANKIMKTRKKMFDELTLVDQVKVNKQVISEVVNKKWQDILIHINSTNPSDWKLAILECDIILGDILEKMGYTQGSIGEKLKSIEVSDFTNIEAAWEAHKIRNAIAHEGSEFAINEREAKRVIGLYELVFKEFEYI